MIKIIFIGDKVLEVIDIDDIEEIKEAIHKKDKLVRIENQIINLDNVAYIEYVNKYRE